MICRNCGFENKDGAKFCQKCGQPLGAVPGQNKYGAGPKQGQPAASASKSRTPVIVLLVVLIVLLVAILGFFLYNNFFRKGHTSEPEATTSESASTKKAKADDNAAADTGYDALIQDMDNASYKVMRIQSTDVSDYPNVKLYMSLTDDDGTPVTLSSPTAGIKESVNGGKEIERKVKSIEQIGDNQGIGMDILVDKSSSMEGTLPELQSVMEEFIRKMNYDAGDSAEIISFDSYIMYMCSYTNNEQNLLNGISNMTTYGQTSLYDALYTGVENAGNRPGENCVIGFTDGMDTSSAHTYDEVIENAKEKNIPIYLIGTSEADASTLESLTSETGGSYWDVNAITDVSDILNQIYAVQRDTYCLEYESDSSIDAYTERQVSCVVKDGNAGGTLMNYDFTPTRKILPGKHDSRYELVKDDISWTDANDAAIAKGGHLATVNSKEEEKTLEKMADKAGLKYIWLGGYTSVRDDVAFGHWMTGEPFDYTKWYDGEPSRNDKDGEPEFYLMLWKIKGKWSWNDERNDVIHIDGLDYFKGNMGYIIEYES